jgi:hypothetical protein
MPAQWHQWILELWMLAQWHQKDRLAQWHQKDPEL